MADKPTDLFAELSRRRVWQVAVAYGSTALAAVLAVEALYDDLGFPEGTTRVVLLAALFGLPVTLLLAWFYEVRREEPSAGSDRPPSLDVTPIRFTPTPHTVGRAAVMDRLRGVLESVVSDRSGKLVCVTGEAGMGKTTVAGNLLAELSGQDMTLARGRCSERLAGAEAYLPLLEALESLLRGDSARSVHTLMARTAPHWLAQLGPGLPTVESAVADAPVSQERLKLEMTRFLERLTEERPLVLFLEDLHWADASTIDILSYLADRFEGLRLLVLTTYRPDDMRLGDHPFLQIRPTLEQRGLLVELPLRFLTPEEVEEYITLELGGQHLPGEIAALIHEKTEGSPLFAADLLRDLRSRGLIERRDGRWAVRGSADELELELPGSVRSVIERKVERIAPEEQAVLLCASVQGDEFDAVIVADALDTDAVEVEERLGEIERVHSLITRVGERDLPDGTLTLRFRFVHVLYQNILYASLTPSRRVQMARGVAEALARRHPGESARIAAGVALLYETARQPRLAAHFFVQAAEHAGRVFAHHEVVRLATRGLEALSGVDEGPERDRVELALRTVLAPSLQATRGWASPEARENTHRAERLCRQVGTDEDVFSMLCGALAVHLVQGTIDEARPINEELLEIATRLDDPARLLAAHAAFGDTHFLAGEFREARLQQKAGLGVWSSREWEALPTFFAQHPTITCLGSGSWCLAWTGFPDRALAEARRATDLAAELDHPFAMHAFDYLQHVHEMRCEWPEALQAADVLAAAHEPGHPYFDGATQVIRGRVLARTGSPAEGLEMMQQAVAWHDAGGFLLFRPRSWIWIAEALARLGDFEQGLAYVDRALAASSDGGVRTYLADAHRAKGDLLRLEGRDSGAAERSYREAIRVAREQDAQLFELRAAVGMVQLFEDHAHPADAVEVLHEVHGRLTEGFEVGDVREGGRMLARSSG